MQPALATTGGQASPPLDEWIRIAALAGYPWMVVGGGVMERFLSDPSFDLRDLKRLFLRTQPAAVEYIPVPSVPEPLGDHLLPHYRDARRIGAPVVVLQPPHLRINLAQQAEEAARWSTVVALAPPVDPSPETLDQARDQIGALDHPALGLYLDLPRLWRAGLTLRPDDVQRAVLVEVGDLDGEGRPCPPGEGVVPLPELLQPFWAGGYDGLAVLRLPLAAATPEAAGRWREALEAQLSPPVPPVGEA